MTTFEVPDRDVLVELTDEDFGPIRLLFGVLESASGIGGLESIEIHATVNGEQIVVGYGEAGEPALLIREEKKLLCECGWRGDGNHYHLSRLGRSGAEGSNT